MAMTLQRAPGTSPYAVPPETGYGAPSAAALALGLRSDLVEWWSVRHGGNELVSSLQYWRGRMPEIKMQPVVADQLPTLTLTGGLDSEPFFAGRTSAPPYPLITPSGTQVVPNGSDWTIAAVARGGTGAASSLGGIVGSSGGCVEILMRSSDLARVQTVDGSNNVTLRLSITCPTASWQYIFCSYRASTGEMQLWLGNALGTGATPSITGLSLAAHTERLSLWGRVDTALGVPNTIHDNRISEVWVFRTALHVNTEARAALRAVVAETYPSLTLA